MLGQRGAILIVVCLVLPCESRAAQVAANVIAPLIDESFDAWDVPGMAVAVVHKHETLLVRGYGVCHRDDPEPVEESTLFYIASATKSFTATTLGMLADERKLALDQSVTHYLPDFALADPDLTQKLTVRDLLAQRSGLPRADLLTFSGFTAAEQIAHLAALRPVAALRTRFTYQNQMYLVLGRIGEQLAGTSWQAFLESRLLHALGMQDSNAAGLGHMPEDASCAAPHAEVDGTVQPIDLVPRAPTGAGAINASARDLALWLRFQLGDGSWNGKPLASAQVMEVTKQPQMILQPTLWMPDANFALYGLGWFLSDYHGRRVVQHGGNGEGWTALVWMLPQEELGVAVLTNMHNTLLPWAVAHRVADAVLGRQSRDWNAHFREAQRTRDATIAKQAPKSAAGTLDATEWAGTWESPVFGQLAIVADPSALRLEYGPALRAKLEPMSGTTGAATARGAVATWQRSDVRAVIGKCAMRLEGSGASITLTLVLGGDAIEFRRAR